MQILPSLGKGELADYPVPPNFETKYKEMEKVIQSAQEKMEDGAFQGSDGKSAYQYARENGFTGTEREFSENSQ